MSWKLIQVVDDPKQRRALHELKERLAKKEAKEGKE
jgi:hypothetical protein